MSIGAVSGPGGIGAAPLNWEPAATKASTTTTNTATQGSATAPASGEPATDPSAKKPAQPFLLIPTEPLTPKVLAELVGLQLFPSEPSAT